MTGQIIGTVIGIAIILLVELIVSVNLFGRHPSQPEEQPVPYSFLPLPRDTREEIPEHMVHDVLAGVTPDELKITILMDIPETPVIFTANELRALMINAKKWTISYGEKRIGKFGTKTEAEAARLQLLYECGKDNTEEDFEI